ncbi:prephenate dehydrogenase/arogenate dehydrogenase family protein [Pelotomaculum propionicicum]|uniref:prephenate dehydrogenase/arogenate dehydrogenase family protein n=1 Tax=Pelotomaculum propionicicum TaxID=258475 RepID=UPI003B7C40E0
MNPVFKRAAIIGVGLIGGSLGMSLCSRRLAGEVVGAGSRVENLRLAVELGAVNRYAGSPAEGVAGADLVIIATPVSATLPVLRDILPYLEPEAVVTDVGSTKSEIVRAAEKILPPGISFVGGHPMAGSEHNGVSGADPYLFENAFYLITPTAATQKEALVKVKKLAVGVGAKVVEIDPERHDLAVAAVSHLPHLLAAALVNTVARMPESESVLPFAAGGFRDTTRIAAGSPLMWRDIFASNRAQVLKMIHNFRGELDLLERFLQEGEMDLIQSALEDARAARTALPAKTRGYLPSLFEVILTVPDQPGIIAGFTICLAESGVNITEIEILRVREGEGGTIRVGFATEPEQENAIRVLREKGYTVRKK